MTNKVIDTPRNIWGKVVYYLKQNGFNALHVVCGSISDVSIDDRDFVVMISEDYSYNFIMEDNNLSYIKRAFNWQETNLTLNIQKKAKQVDKFSSDIEKLKKIVEPKYLTIKGD